MTFFEFYEREWQKITDPEKLQYLLKEKLKNVPMYRKNSVMRETFHLKEVTGEGAEFQSMASLQVGESVVLYATLKRHIEIEFICRRRNSGSVLLVPAEGRIGKAVRLSGRIPVKNKDAYVSNFRIPSRKNSGSFGIRDSLTNQVIFDDFTRLYSDKIPGLQIINAFIENLDEELRCLKDTEKKIYIRNLSDLQPPPEGEEYLNIPEALKSNAVLEKRINHMKENGIASFVAVPIVSRTDNDQNLTVGYITSGAGELIPREIPEIMEELSREILFRMAEANSIPVKVSQEIVNVSMGGVAMKITDKTLNLALPEKKKMIFDLVFAGQAPLRFQGDVCYVDKKDQHLIAGVSFRGIGHTGTGTGNMRRFEKYLESLKKAN